MKKFLIYSALAIATTVLGYGFFWLLMMAVTHDPAFIFIPAMVILGYFLYIDKK